MVNSALYIGFVRSLGVFVGSLLRFHQTRLSPAFRVPVSVRTVLPAASRMAIDGADCGAFLSQ